MSIIRVSGSSRGKVHRVYGSSNYVSSIQPVVMKRKKKKKKKKVTEASYYSQMITITKNHLNSKNSTNYVKKVRKVGKRLSENTLIKILNAYQDTLMVNPKVNNQRKKIYLSNNLERNLKKYKVSQSTTDKILNYDPDHSKKLITKENIPVKRDENKRSASKRTKKDTEQIEMAYSYFTKIIDFSYLESSEDAINNFIININRNNKILSDSLIRNIIMAYKISIKNNKQSSKLLKQTLEKNLDRKGVHDDIINIIFEVDNKL